MPNDNKKLVDVVLNHIKTVGLSKDIMYKDNYIYVGNTTTEMEDLIEDPHNRPGEMYTVTIKVYDFIRTYKVDDENYSFELQVNKGVVTCLEMEEPGYSLDQNFKPADLRDLKEDMKKDIDLLWKICDVCNIDLLKLCRETQLTNLENKRLELQQECEKINDKINSLIVDREQLKKTLSEIDSAIEQYNYSESKSEGKQKKLLIP